MRPSVGVIAAPEPHQRPLVAAFGSGLSVVPLAYKCKTVVIQEIGCFLSFYMINLGPD